MRNGDAINTAMVNYIDRPLRSSMFLPDLFLLQQGLSMAADADAIDSVVVAMLEKFGVIEFFEKVSTQQVRTS